MSNVVVVGSTAAAYFVFAAAADAMSPPTAEQEHGWYGFFFRFIQRLAANANRVVATRYPTIYAEAHPDSSTVVAIASSTTSK